MKARSCGELNHVQIHNNPEVIEIVASIIAANLGLGGLADAPPAQPVNVENWTRRLTMAQQDWIDVRLR